MPKLTGPLMSVEAHKQLAKALTYQRRPGGASVYGYKKPKVPLTWKQRGQRWLIQDAVALWQVQSPTVKAEWEAKAKGRGQSGYSLFMHENTRLSDDVVLYLPGVEGEGTIIHDLSKYRNHGTIVGASWARLPSGLWYLGVDGLDDRVEAASQFGDVDFESVAFTISFWAKMDSAKEASQAVVGIKPTTATNRGVQFFLRTQEGAIRAILVRADSDTANREAVSTDLAVFSNDVWAMFTLDFNGGNWGTTDVGIYVNDSASLSTGADLISDTWQANNNKICIGAGVATYPDAGIALLKVLNRRWTTLERQNHYNATKHLLGA